MTTITSVACGALVSQVLTASLTPTVTAYLFRPPYLFRVIASTTTLNRAPVASLSWMVQTQGRISLSATTTR